MVLLARAAAIAALAIFLLLHGSTRLHVPAAPKPRAAVSEKPLPKSRIAPTGKTRLSAPQAKAPAGAASDHDRDAPPADLARIENLSEHDPDAAVRTEAARTLHLRHG